MQSSHSDRNSYPASSQFYVSFASTWGDTELDIVVETPKTTNPLT
jgi:hypothetical protein